MKRFGILIALLGLSAGPGLADTLVAARTLRAQSVITPEDLVLSAEQIDGALSSPADAIGFETRVAIYAGRPIRLEDLGPPAIVERNQIVPLIFRQRGLSIQTEGRALDRGGAGDTIRVMNLASKTTLSATLAADGSATVLNQ